MMPAILSLMGSGQQKKTGLSSITSFGRTGEIVASHIGAVNQRKWLVHAALTLFDPQVCAVLYSKN
jgi:hypothetical protein